MRDVRSVAASCGFVLTAKGREALKEAQLCACRIVMDGGLLMCRDCDTVYGLTSQIGLGLNRPVLIGKGD